MGHVKLKVSWRSSNNRCKDTRRDVKSVVMGALPPVPLSWLPQKSWGPDVRFMSSQSVLLRVSVFAPHYDPNHEANVGALVMLSSVRRMYQQQGCKVMVTGHSLGGLSGRSGCDHLRRPHVQPINSHSELTNSLSHLRDTYIYTFIYWNDMCIYIYIYEWPYSIYAIMCSRHIRFIWWLHSATSWRKWWIVWGTTGTTPLETGSYFQVGESSWFSWICTCIHISAQYLGGPTLFPICFFVALAWKNIFRLTKNERF